MQHTKGMDFVLTVLPPVRNQAGIIRGDYDKFQKTHDKRAYWGERGPIIVRDENGVEITDETPRTPGGDQGES